MQHKSSATLMGKANQAVVCPAAGGLAGVVRLGEVNAICDGLR